MHKKYLILLTLTLSLFTSACHKKDDSKKDTNITLLALSIADLLSGQCLKIEREETGKYAVTGYNVPKGACNTDRLGKVTTTNIDAALESSTASFKNVIDILDEAGSDCNSTKSTIVSDRDSVTASTIQADATNKCAEVGFEAGGSKYGSRVYCKDENQAATYRSKFKYVTTSNVKTDLADSVTAVKTIMTSGKALNGWTDEQIDAVGTMNVTQAPVFLKYAPTFIKVWGTEMAVASATAGAATLATTKPNLSGACSKAILSSIPSSAKNLFVRNALFPPAITDGVAATPNLLATVTAGLQAGGATAQQAAAAAPGLVTSLVGSYAFGGKRLALVTEESDMTNFNPLMPYFQCVYGASSSEGTVDKTCVKELPEF